jgi:HEAT repeat protein
MPPPITTALRLLQKPDPDSRRQAVRALTRLAPSSQAAVRALAATLRDPDERLRFMAADALGKIGTAAEPAVPALLDALEDDAAGLEALETLVGMGKVAVPGLLAVLKGGEPGLTLRAADVLTRISARLPPPSAEH